MVIAKSGFATGISSLLMAALSSSVATGALAQSYIVTDLGERTDGMAITQSGQVAGSENPNGEQPFVTINGNLVPLSTLHNDAYARATTINSSGTVVGLSCNAGELACSAVSWGAGSAPTLIVVGFYPSSGNDAGEYAGFTASSVPATLSKGVVTDLPVLQGKAGSHVQGYANAINSSGQIAGEIDLFGPLASDDTYHAVTWIGGKIQDLGSQASASGINDQGQVVGYSGSYGAVWINGILKQLEGVNGAYSMANAINDDGIVVGNMFAPDDETQYGVTWINGVVHQLNDMIDPSSPVKPFLADASAINKTGQILAVGSIPADGVAHAYLLTPTGVSQAAAAPAYSLLPRSYATTQTVTLVDTTPTAVIHYTLDGSAPTIQSPVYKIPVSISRTTTVSAIAMATGYTDSAVASATYTIVTPNAQYQPIDFSSIANVQAIGAGGLQAKSGLDNLKNVYASDVLGTSLMWSGIPFNFMTSASANGASNVTVVVPSGHFSSIKLLGTATRGNRDHETFVVNYTDGTSKSIVQGMSDWATPQSYPGESTTLTMEHRVSVTGVFSHGPYHLYGYTLDVDSTKTVQSLTLPAWRYVIVVAGAMVGKAGDVKLCAHESLMSRCDLSSGASSTALERAELSRATTSDRSL